MRINQFLVTTALIAIASFAHADPVEINLNLTPNNGFKMYKKANAVPNPGCDKHTWAELDVDGQIGSIQLSEHVGGACEIKILENRRSYNLVLSKTSNCGVSYYTQDDDSDSAIEVIDRRSIVQTGKCAFVQSFKVKSALIIKEYDEKGKIHWLYSQENF